MRLKRILTCFALLAAAGSASAGPVMVGFEGCGEDFSGDLSVCASPVTFSGPQGLRAVTLVNAPTGSGNFLHIGEPSNVTAMAFGSFEMQDTTLVPVDVGLYNTLTVGLAGGFNSFSMRYTTLQGTTGNFVQLLDVNGKAIASASGSLVTPTPLPPEDCDVGISCAWKTLTIDLGANSKAYSVAIDAQQMYFYFDDLTFRSVDDTGNNVPEPTGAALTLAALGALALTRRRRRS